VKVKRIYFEILTDLYVFGTPEYVNIVYMKTFVIVKNYISKC
jgi:hypothetical protein